MIPWEYNIYGITTDDYISGSEVNGIGKMLNTDTYQYFNTSGKPLYTADCSALLDDSVYLWHVGGTSAAATNAAYCIGKSDTLDMQISMNKVDNAPLGMQLCNIDSESFKRYPKGRMAYDYWSYLWFNYVNSRMFVDINRTKYCMRPRAVVYDTASNQITAQSLQSLPAYINASPNTRFVTSISCELYHGDETPRTLDYTYIPGTALKGAPCVDILTERPVPDNATGAKTDMLYTFNDVYNAGWITDRQYSPFAQAYTGLWYSGDLQSDNPFYIGFRQSRSVSQIRNGSYSPAHGDNVTGGFIKYNDTVQDFDDVTYKWTLKAYYINGGVFLSNGFPLTSLNNNEYIYFFTDIEIIDHKGLTHGAALQAAMKHEVAYIGFYFADTLDDAQNTTLGVANDHIFLPEIVGGVTTGNYFTGAEIPLCPYAGSTSVSDDAFKYDPADAPINDDEGLTDTIINTGTISAGVTYYAMTDANVKDLTTWLNTTYNPADETEFIQDFKGTNPGDYITTVMYYPFDIPYTGTSQPVTVGKLTAGSTQGAKLTYEYGNMYSYGSYTFPKFGDFRDYLTKLSVIIPFCGTVELDPIIWAGREITIKMAVDFPTGVCTAYLYRTGANGAKAIIDSVSGQIGVPLPLSSFSNGSYQVAITNMLAQGAATNRQIMMSTLGAGAGVITAAVGAYTGNYKMAFGGAVAAVTSNSQANAGADKLENIAYNIDHTKPTLQSVSGGSPFINCGQDYRCIVIRCIPVFAPGYDAAAYGKTTGFATCRQGALSSISHGFTQCAGVDLDAISATATEKAMIFKALQSGVFV